LSFYDRPLSQAVLEIKKVMGIPHDLFKTSQKMTYMHLHSNTKATGLFDPWLINMQIVIFQNPGRDI
jgi:hypothetical protein